MGPLSSSLGCLGVDGHRKATVGLTVSPCPDLLHQASHWLPRRPAPPLPSLPGPFDETELSVLANRVSEAFVKACRNVVAPCRETYPLFRIRPRAPTLGASVRGSKSLKHPVRDRCALEWHDESHSPGSRRSYCKKAAGFHRSSKRRPR